MARLAGDAGARSGELSRLTGGNPFFVTEALATSSAQAPATVVDAVLARVGRLDASTRAALDRLSVVPSRVELPLARALLGDLRVIDGDWRAAAAAWGQVGAPYERALELLESGEATPVLEALAEFTALGAGPAAALAGRRLRELGVHQVPRGPQPTTRANPAGLTARQVEILELLGHGMTNAEIAARLVLSVRTVDHHVSAILQKLDIPNRREATAAARRLGLGSAARGH